MQPKYKYEIYCIIYTVDRLHVMTASHVGGTVLKWNIISRTIPK